MPSEESSGTLDQILVKRFLVYGDEKSFRELYRRYTPALYSLALRLVNGSAPDAQDAIQDTWIRACKSLARFEWRSSLRTWLTGILINRVREFTREYQSRHEENLTEESKLADSTPTEQRIDLEQAIARLPNGYRHVLILHDAEGYTHEEIGVLLDVSVGTSKSQLHHARQAVRALLNGVNIK
ncbi:MAG TPA: RNA polymerase sigma factor [Candidatus Binatia bacterium]